MKVFLGVLQTIRGVLDYLGIRAQGYRQGRLVVAGKNFTDGSCLEGSSTLSIAVPCAFDFLVELLCKLDKLEPSSSNAENLCLDLEPAEIEAEIDFEGPAMVSPGGGMLAAGSSPSLLLLSPSSRSTSIPISIPFSIPLLDEARKLEAVP